MIALEVRVGAFMDSKGVVVTNCRILTLNVDTISGMGNC